MATVAFGGTIVFYLVAANAESVSPFEIPFFVDRVVGIFVAGVACNLCLVLRMWKHCRPLACLSFQEDLGWSIGMSLLTFFFIFGCFSTMGKYGHKNQHACE